MQTEVFHTNFLTGFLGHRRVASCVRYVLFKYATFAVVTTMRVGKFPYRAVDGSTIY
jgi:hypothetical protein